MLFSVLRFIAWPSASHGGTTCYREALLGSGTEVSDLADLQIGLEPGAFGSASQQLQTLLAHFAAAD